MRRLLVGLVEIGFAAVDDDGRISLGGRLLGLGSADAAQIATTFRPTLERVAELTGRDRGPVHPARREMWFIDQIESGHRLRVVSAVGDRFPLHDTANGKAAPALLLGAAEVDDLLAHVAAIGPTRCAPSWPRPAPAASPSTATSTPRGSRPPGSRAGRPAATSSPSRYRLHPPFRGQREAHRGRTALGARRAGLAGLTGACQRLRGGTQWLT